MSKLTPFRISYILSSYKEGNSSLEIAKEIGLSKTTILSVLNKYGKLRSMSEAKRKYALSEDYFKTIDSEDKAYWLGFLAADCSIYTGKGRHSLKLCLASKDKDHLILFKNTLSYEKLVRAESSRIKSLGKTYPSVSVYIDSKELVEQLSEYGLVQNKHSTIRIPTLNKNLVRHFIRGYLDGDGSIYLRKDCHSIVFAFTSNKDMIEDISSTFCKELLISRPNFTKDNRSKNTYTIKYGTAEEVKKIYNYLYKPSSLYLERKKVIADSFFGEEL